MVFEILNIIKQNPNKSAQELHDLTIGVSWDLMISLLSDFEDKEIINDNAADIKLTDKGILYLDTIKPKHWSVKPEFLVSSLIAVIALFVPFIIRNLDKTEQSDLVKKQEIQAKVDSIYMASRSYSDSLLQITNNSINDLKDSLYNSSLDSINIKH